MLYLFCAFLAYFSPILVLFSVIFFFYVRAVYHLKKAILTFFLYIFSLYNPLYYGVFTYFQVLLACWTAGCSERFFFHFHQGALSSGPLKNSTVLCHPLQEKGEFFSFFLNIDKLPSGISEASAIIFQH